MFKELNEIVDYIKISKFAKKSNEILQKIKQLKQFILNNDYKNAFDFALYINRTIDFKGLFCIRNDLYLVESNPDKIQQK